MPQESDSDKAEAAVRLYSRLFLRFYDRLALGFNCRLIWRCPTRHMLNHYNTHVSGNHLDIGVGTGYFMDRCTFPVPSPRLALMDLSPNSLQAASKRLARYNPEVYQRNALEPFDIYGGSFDSVARSMAPCIHTAKRFSSMNRRTSS